MFEKSTLVELHGWQTGVLWCEQSSVSLDVATVDALDANTGLQVPYSEGLAVGRVFGNATRKRKRHARTPHTNTTTTPRHKKKVFLLTQLIFSFCISMLYLYGLALCSENTDRDWSCGIGCTVRESGAPSRSLCPKTFEGRQSALNQQSAASNMLTQMSYLLLFSFGAFWLLNLQFFWNQ